MIIGLTGRNGSGKGAVADYFVSRGCNATSLSDELRAWLRARGSEPTRDNLIAGGLQIRTEGGGGVLASLALQRIAREGGDWVVDSVRNPMEVEVLRERPDFVLLDVQADVQTRFQRVMARARGGDAVDFEQFLRQEQAELAPSDKAAQQLLATAALADVVVHNDGSLQALHEALAGVWSRAAAGPDAVGSSPGGSLSDNDNDNDNDNARNKP